MKLVVFIILGIILSVGLPILLDTAGIMILVGIALGGLFYISYQLENIYRK